MNVGDFKIYLAGFMFLFARRELKITLCNDSTLDNEQLSTTLWIRLIFGIIDPRDLVELRDIKFLPLVRIMFPQESPQVPFLDQF